MIITIGQRSHWSHLTSSSCKAPLPSKCLVSLSGMVETPNFIDEGCPVGLVTVGSWQRQRTIGRMWTTSWAFWRQESKSEKTIPRFCAERNCPRQEAGSHRRWPDKECSRFGSHAQRREDLYRPKLMDNQDKCARRKMHKQTSVILAFITALILVVMTVGCRAPSDK